MNPTTDPTARRERAVVIALDAETLAAAVKIAEAISEGTGDIASSLGGVADMLERIATVLEKRWEDDA